MPLRHSTDPSDLEYHSYGTLSIDSMAVGGFLSPMSRIFRSCPLITQNIPLSFEDFRSFSLFHAASIALVPLQYRYSPSSIGEISTKNACSFTMCRTYTFYYQCLHIVEHIATCEEADGLGSKCPAPEQLHQQRQGDCTPCRLGENNTKTIPAMNTASPAKRVSPVKKTEKPKNIKSLATPIKKPTKKDAQSVVSTKIKELAQLDSELELHAIAVQEAENHLNALLAAKERVLKKHNSKKIEKQEIHAPVPVRPITVSSSPLWNAYPASTISSHFLPGHHAQQVVYIQQQQQQQQPTNPLIVFPPLFFLSHRPSRPRWRSPSPGIFKSPIPMFSFF